MAGSDEDLLGDGRLLKRRVVAGRGRPPKSGSLVRVHYESTVVASGHVLDTSFTHGEPFEFILGGGSVVEAWNVGVAAMLPGETCELLADASLAYGEEGLGDEVPPGAAMRFRIQLLGSDIASEAAAPDSKDADGDSDEQRLCRAQGAKESGNRMLKEGSPADARAAYAEALAALRGMRGTDIELSKARNALRLACLLNLAQCELKLEDFAASARHATEALEIDPRSVKALCRRGVARMSYGLLPEARADLLEASRLEPQNAEIRGRLAECRAKLAQAQETIKAAFGGMFGKAPEQAVSSRDVSRLPRPWMDFQIGGSPPMRLHFALYSDTVPRTAQNFLALCTGARGVGRCGQPLHYRHSLVHRVVAGSLVEAGDVESYDGTGGESIYGATFEDEGFRDSHHKRGLLSMSNRGPGTNNSKFFITLRSLPQFDGKHVVFGEVVGDASALEAIERVETRYPDRPVVQVAVVDCGVAP